MHEPRVAEHERSTSRCPAPLPKLHWQPFAPDGAVTDQHLIDSAGLRAIHTPGHSPGHLAFLHEPSGTVLVGDAVFYRGTLALGPSALAAYPDLRLEGLHGLPRTINAIGFAHGPALTRPDQIKLFRTWLDTLQNPHRDPGRRRS